MNINTCSFTFVSLHTNLSRRVVGIERTWDYLKNDFHRDGDGLPGSGVRYFETITTGPQLFAVRTPHVFYHHDNQWYQYISASDIVFGTMEIPE